MIADASRGSFEGNHAPMIGASVSGGAIGRGRCQQDAKPRGNHRTIVRSAILVPLCQEAAHSELIA